MIITYAIINGISIINKDVLWILKLTDYKSYVESFSTAHVNWCETIKTIQTGFIYTKK